MTGTTINQSTTLFDFEDEPEDTRADEIIRQYTEDCTDDEFAEYYWDQGIGGHCAVNDINKATKPDLLRKYRERLKTLGITPFSDNPTTRRAYKLNYKDRIDALDNRVAYLEFPHPSKWRVSKSRIEEIAELDYPEENNRDADMAKWRDVWESHDSDDLKFIQRTISDYVKWRSSSSGVCEILQTFRFLKNDDSLTIEDLVTFPKRGKGASREKVKLATETVLNRIDPVLAGFAVQWLNEIKTNKEPTKTRYGNHNRSGHWINVVREYGIDRDDADSTAAHELAHVIFYIVGGYTEDGSLDNRKKDSRDDWGCEWADVGDSLPQYEEFRETLRDAFEAFKNEDFNSITGYQRKNPNELNAVAFEYWIVASDTLEDEQPFLKNAFDEYIGLGATPEPTPELTEAPLTSFCE